MKLVNKTIQQNPKAKKLIANNSLAVLKCALCSLLAIIILFSLTPVTVYADICQDFTGNEDATDESQFEDERNQNIYKIWSVMRSAGFDENQTLAILANFAGEGGCNAWSIEGYYMDSMKSFCGVSSAGPEMAAYFTEHHSEYTDYFLQRAYSVSSTDITRLHNGQSTARSYNTNANFYYVDGVGYCGIGLAGWTGPNAKILMDFADAHQANWYDIESQLCFMLASPDQGGDSTMYSRLMRFKTETAGKSYQDCVSFFVKHYEIPHDIPGAIIRRTQYAGQFYQKLHGKGWDEQYGADVVSGVGLNPAYNRNGILDISMVHDWTAAAIYYPWNSGMLTASNEDILAKNQEVYLGYINSLNGTSTSSFTEYSLFELYGEDLHWYRYLGESTVGPGLADHIYSGWQQDKLDDLSVDDFFFEGTDYLSTQVYPGRPTTLTTTDISNGYIDPRVDLESSGRFTGFLYVSGSFDMTIAKYIQSFITMLLGDELLEVAADILTEVETSDLFTSLMPAVWVLIGFAVLALIASLVKNAIRYAHGDANGAPPYALITRFCIAIMCIGLIICSLSQPEVFNDTIVSVVGCIDEVFEASLADGLSEDEVIAVTDPDLSTRAAIWKTCIFEPWCRGQFGGLEYEQLYTQFAAFSDGGDKSSMPQSHQSVEDVGDDVNTPYYDSASLTGDIFVPVGGGKYIKNWAAYLYSCGTPYHIDSTINDAQDVIELSMTEVNFPNAHTTAHNSQLYADTFRIVDAQMNISPQFFKNGNVIWNYTDSNGLDTNFAIEGMVMLVNAGLLLFLVPAIYEKIKNFILLLITTLQCVYYSFLELFKENAGLPDFGRNLKKSLAGYFIADLKIYIMVLLYITFVDKGFVMALIYCLLCFTVLSISLNDITKFTKDVGRQAMSIVDKSNAKHDLERQQKEAAKKARKAAEAANKANK